MKKEEIYVVIDSEEKRKRAIQILSDAGERFSKDCSALYFDEKYKYLRIDDVNKWYIFSFIWRAETELNLDQLEQMLSPKQEIKMELDALKLIAESYGFELVDKKREIKVGDFGKFWDYDSNEICVYRFLERKEGDFFSYVDNFSTSWKNFAYLTEEEKANIQENW
jgi:hypothetical protein